MRVLRVLGEICGNNDLVGSRGAGAITEAIDLDLIKQQTEAGSYCWGCCCRLVSVVVAVIQRVQSPKRDDETKQRWSERQKELLSESAATADAKPRAFCKALEFLLDHVNAMHIDAANARVGGR